MDPSVSEIENLYHLPDPSKDGVARKFPSTRMKLHKSRRFAHPVGHKEKGVDIIPNSNSRKFFGENIHISFFVAPVFQSLGHGTPHRAAGERRQPPVLSPQILRLNLYSCREIERIEVIVWENLPG